MTEPGFFSRRDRGFTLVEIAVVIVILGLILTMLLGISSTMIAQQRRDSTRARLIAVETALTLFASQNQRLPCPADGTLVSTDANAGLAEADVTDGWGTRLTYRASPDFVKQGSMNMVTCDPGGTSGGAALAAPTGYCNPLCTTPFVAGNCTMPSGVTAGRGLTVQNLNPVPTKIMDPAAIPSTGAAYIVISHGENRAGGYDSQGILQAATGPALGTEEGRNAANVALGGYYVDDFPVYLDGTGHFDDFLIRPTILTVATRAQLGPRAH
jgi:prepilin-type N-terminal cleavage/methylation domain-containing protein